MSYIVTVHYCGGSGGEAVPAIKVAHVATEAEASEIEKWVHEHPASYGGRDLWALVYEIPEARSVVDAKSYLETDEYFEVYDE